MNFVKMSLYIGIAFVWLNVATLFPMMEEEITVDPTQRFSEERTMPLSEVFDGAGVQFSSCEKIMVWTGRIGLFVGTMSCSIGTIIGASYSISDAALSLVIGVTGGVAVSIAGMTSQLGYEYYLDRILLNRKRALHLVIESDEKV